MGLAYPKKQDYKHVRDEFLKDLFLRPDLALNYDTDNRRWAEREKQLESCTVTPLKSLQEQQ